MGTRPQSDDIYVGSTDGQKSAGQLVKEVTEDMSTLVRKEIELAKKEIGDSVAAKFKGAAIFAVVGVLAFFALIFVLLAIRDGLDRVLVTWAADLVTAGILLVVGVLAGMFAKRKLATPVSAELTKQNLKEDVDLVKSFGKRG